MVAVRTINIAELGPISSITRLQLLDWISRCNASSTSSIQTSEGVQIEMNTPLGNNRTLLHCEDGTLELLNHNFVFTVMNHKAWEGQVAWLSAQQ